MAVALLDSVAGRQRRAGHLRADAVALLDELLDLVEDPRARRALAELQAAGGWLVDPDTASPHPRSREGRVARATKAT